MEFLTDYGLFFAKTLTIVVAFIILLAFTLALSSKGGKSTKDKCRVNIRKINKHYEHLRHRLQQAMLDKSEYKKNYKIEKKQEKTQKKEVKAHPRRRVFYYRFQGDIRASTAEHLREIVTAILTVAKQQDEVVIAVESGGGLVHGYGLCASQLNRLREQNIPLTVAIDKVAASGGYMMASVANRIIAAPFAIVGSIGVLVQLPNFNRFLKHHKVDFEQLSAGEYKRTLSVFGENSQKARKKLQEEIDDTHILFKDFIKTHRPQLDLDQVATGEYWFGQRALSLQLIDDITTSDDYLLKASHEADIFELSYETKKSFANKISKGMGALINRCFFAWRETIEENKYL